MKIETEFPYCDFNGYLVTNKEDRKHICLVNKIDKSRTTISYARYLMSVKEKRILEDWEQVDHIDENKKNDVIENLQILSRHDNIVKNKKFNGRKCIDIKCPNCNYIFTKYLNSCFLQKGGYFSSCSLKCLYAINSKKLDIEQLKEMGQKSIIRIYKK